MSFEKRYDDLCDLIMEQAGRKMTAETRDIDELVMAMGARIKTLERVVEEQKMVYGNEDVEDEYTQKIDAAHPLVTNDFSHYDQALKMVGNRMSKYALVDLVNWLLTKGE